MSWWLSGLRIELVSMRMRVRSLASLSGLRIQHSCELGCSLQLQLGSGIAVALIQSPAWGLPYATGVALKTKKRKKTVV